MSPPTTGRTSLWLSAVPTAPASPADTCGCDDGRADGCGTPARPARDERWLRTAQTARRLAWASLLWMTLEGAVGFTAAVRAGSVSLLGWALSSVVEGLASVIVIWRFSGIRTLSESSERRAQRAVAGSFWLLAPSIAVDSVHALVRGDRPGVSILGMVITASSVLVMPVLGRVKQHLGVRLGSGATTAEGLQNWLGAATGGAVLLGLAANAALGAWWLDPAVGLGIAAVAVWEGTQAWRGNDCC
jgi:divalent metal cation (Fe/Co/Zn/Cd) transporter